jgi:hypothetical protein
MTSNTIRYFQVYSFYLVYSLKTSISFYSPLSFLRSKVKKSFLKRSYIDYTHFSIKLYGAPVFAKN